MPIIIYTGNIALQMANQQMALKMVDYTLLPPRDDKTATHYFLHKKNPIFFLKSQQNGFTLTDDGIVRSW